MGCERRHLQRHLGCPKSMDEKRTEPTQRNLEWNLPVSEMDALERVLGNVPEVLGCAIHLNWIPIHSQSTQGELPRFGGGGGGLMLDLESIHQITSEFSIRGLAAAEEWRKSGRVLDDCNGMDASDEVMMAWVVEI